MTPEELARSFDEFRRTRGNPDPQRELFLWLAKIVAEEYHIRLPDLLSRSREAVFVRPRHLLAALWSDVNSQADAARQLDRNNAAVIHSVRKARELIQTSPNYLYAARRVVERMTENPYLIPSGVMSWGLENVKK